LAKDKRVFLAAQQDASVDDPKPDAICPMGCVANVAQEPEAARRQHQGAGRRHRPCPRHRVEGRQGLLPRSGDGPANEKDPSGDVEGTMSRVVALFEQYVKLSPNLHYDAMVAAVRVEDPGRLADTIAAHLLVGVHEKQDLLEIISPIERLTCIGGILEIEVQKLQVDRRVQSRVKQQMEKGRRSTTSTKR